MQSLFYQINNKNKLLKAKWIILLIATKSCLIQAQDHKDKRTYSNKLSTQCLISLGLTYQYF